MRMLTKREVEILYLLRNSKGIQTGKSISIFLGVSTRTIRNDIKELNTVLLKNGANIVSSKGIGYELETFNEVLFEKQYQVYIESNKKILERSNISCETNEVTDLIIRKLLMNSLIDYNINQQDLAYELFMSLSTLKNYIPKINSKIETFDLKVITDKSNGIRISGSEDKIRYSISEFIFNHACDNFYNDIFPNHQIEKIKEIILGVLLKHNLRLTDVALNSLVIHLEITIHRSLKERSTIFNEENILTLENTDEFKIAHEIIKKFNLDLNINIFPEIYYVTQHLLTSSKLSGGNINSPEYKNIYTMLQKILLVVKDKRDIDFMNDQLLIDGLILHLSVALNRIKFNMNIRNEILSSIKINYPLAFELAIIVSHEISDNLKLSINENEIGFIAIHFGAALERLSLNTKENIKKIIIVCGSGFATASLIRERISKSYGQQVSVIETTSLAEFNKNKLDEADIVISTVPITNIKSKKILTINSIMSDEDLSNFEKVFMVEDSNDNLSNYREIFVRELFVKNLDLNSKEAVLKHITNLMVDGGYIDEYTKKSIYKREIVASTELGRLVAIPHALDNNMKDIAISVCVLKNPIYWDKEKVQVVVVLSVPKKQQKNWERVFRKLHQFLLVEFGVSNLIAEYDYDDFIRNLSK